MACSQYSLAQLSVWGFMDLGKGLSFWFEKVVQNVRGWVDLGAKIERPVRISPIGYGDEALGAEVVLGAGKQALKDWKGFLEGFPVAEGEDCDKVGNGVAGFENGKALDCGLLDEGVVEGDEFFFLGFGDIGFCHWVVVPLGVGGGGGWRVSGGIQPPPSGLNLNVEDVPGFDCVGDLVEGPI